VGRTTRIGKDQEANFLGQNVGLNRGKKETQKRNDQSGREMCHGDKGPELVVVREGLSEI